MSTLLHYWGKAMKSCNFNEHYLGKLQSIFLHILSSHSLLLFTLDLAISPYFLTISYSSNLSTGCIFSLLLWFQDIVWSNFIKFWSISLHSCYLRLFHHGHPISKFLGFFSSHFISSHLISMGFVSVCPAISGFHSLSWMEILPFRKGNEILKSQDKI